MDIELIPYDGRMLTSEEIKLAEYFKQKKLEMARRREKDEQLQRELDIQATKRGMTQIADIKTTAPPPPPQLPSSAVVANKAVAVVAVKKRKPEDGAGKEEPQEETWNFGKTSSSSSSTIVKTAPIIPAEEVGSISAASQVSAIPAAVLIEGKGELVMPLESGDGVAIPAKAGHKYMAKKRKVLAREELDEAAFPPTGDQGMLLLSQDWNPAEHKEDTLGKTFTLDDFDYARNQTLALKLTIPSSSTRWAINIAPPEHDNWKEVLFHFNPRRFKKEELLMNSRTDKIWRKAEVLQLSDLPPLFEKNNRECNFELIIQIRAEGFCTFLNRNFLSYFPHRRDISVYQQLVIQLPSVDDNGNFNNAIFHKVWWGHLDNHVLRLPSDIEVKSGAYDGDICSVFIKGLPKNDVEGVESIIWNIFEPFHPVLVNVIAPKGVAYVKLTNSNSVYEAISQLNGIGLQGEGGDSFTLSVMRANE